MRLGIFAAIRHNSWVDQGAMYGRAAGAVAAGLLVRPGADRVFCVELRWLPTGGFVPLTENPLGWLRSMTLPSLTLAFTQMGVLARMTRSSMLDVLGHDYVRTARAKGMPGRVVIFKHAFATR